MTLLGCLPGGTFNFPLEASKLSREQDSSIPRPGPDKNLLILSFFEANHMRIRRFPLTYLRKNSIKNKCKEITTTSINTSH